MAYMNRGRVWHGKGHFDRAIADFTEAIERHSTQSRRGVLSLTYWLIEKLLIIDQATEPHGDSGLVHAYEARSQSRHAKNDYQGALADLTKALELDPKDAQAFRLRGHTRAALGENEKALTDFAEAIRLDPANSTAYLSAGNVWSKMGDHDRAVDDFSAAIRLDPEHARDRVLQSRPRVGAG